MFITVRYGFNQSLLFNPSCTVINLLRNIRIRCGYGNSNFDIDLADETGVIKELGKFQYESAEKLLPPNNSYILVGRLPDYQSPDEETAALSSEEETFARKITYKFVPLLERYEDLLPNYRLQSSADGSHVSKSLMPSNKTPMKKRCRKYGRANTRD